MTTKKQENENELQGTFIDGEGVEETYGNYSIGLFKSLGRAIKTELNEFVAFNPGIEKDTGTKIKAPLTIQILYCHPVTKITDKAIQEYQLAGEVTKRNSEGAKTIAMTYRDLREGATGLWQGIPSDIIDGCSYTRHFVWAYVPSLATGNGEPMDGVYPITLGWTFGKSFRAVVNQAQMGFVVNGKLVKPPLGSLLLELGLESANTIGADGSKVNFFKPTLKIVGSAVKSNDEYLSKFVPMRQSIIDSVNLAQEVIDKQGQAQLASGWTLGEALAIAAAPPRHERHEVQALPEPVAAPARQVASKGDLAF